jgi:hypothetical protein
MQGAMRLLAFHLLRFAALALLAFGLSGLLAEPVAWKTGMDYFTGDDRASVSQLSVERCAELTRLHRRQRTCAGALVEDHFGELVQYGLVATLAGAAALLLLGRFLRLPVGRGEAALEALLLTAAAVAFAAVGAADLPEGLAGLPGLLPGSGRSLLRGGVTSLFAAWQALRATGAWRRLLA